MNTIANFAMMFSGVCCIGLGLVNRKQKTKWKPVFFFGVALLAFGILQSL